MLEVKEIHTYYGESHVLFGVSMNIDEGEVVCLLGRNGVGKTTSIKSIMGLTPPRSGSIRFREQEIQGLAPHKIARYGIGYVPEDRCIFFGLSVRENLEVAIKSTVGPNIWTLERIYGLFPVLKEREGQQGTTLSGGEQQMLAIARTLMGNPQLLLLDEPSEGLAPLVVRALVDQLLKLKEEGVTMLLCEDSAALAYTLADRAYLMEKGQVGWSGTIDEFRENEDLKVRYLGV